jgi:uncharacterized protein (TIGR03790 family)
MLSRLLQRLVVSAALLAVGAGCGPVPEEDAGKPPAPTAGGRVLVVANERSPDGIAVAQYYMRAREVPATNFMTVDVTTDDEIGDIDFRLNVVEPVKKAIQRLPQRIDFILLTTGIPLRIQNNRGYSVDAHLAGMHLAIPPMVGLDTSWLRRYRNPYYNAIEPFNSDKFAMYLVTRLDCAKRDDCIALIDRSLAAQPVRGPFFFDAMRERPGSTDGYGIMDTQLHLANQRLAAMGAYTILDNTRQFVAPDQPLAGYVSWGSNDNAFDAAAYHRLRFLPGALAETFVSTSARTFKPTTGGQSRIVDLIEQGVTGVKGYVGEPYTLALANPVILFDRYLRGFTLAEAFYASSRMILWKDLVIGDPLCAPYSQFTVSAPGSSRGM